MRLLNLTWGENPARSGKGHAPVEWHAPCGCAYHPEPKPHIHPCAVHELEPTRLTAEELADGLDTYRP